MSSPEMSPKTATTTTTVPASAVSTPPSSPPADDKVNGDDADYDPKNGVVKEENKMSVDIEDDDEMDHKSRALTNLLKTSSVFVAIMADKMKEQQKKSAEDAKRAAAKRKRDEEQADKDKGPVRKSARVGADEVADEEKENGTEKQKKMPTRGRGRPAANKAQDKKKNILDYMKNEDINTDEGPSVQEALADEADKYEGEGLGAQTDLVATEQPALITGGKMKHYQLEGLEWLKSLWMNGLCGILADEMGLGKTLQALSMIAFFKDNNISGPFLIAAPLSTVRNWIEEFKFWAPGIKTVLYHGSKDEREKIRRKQMKMNEQSKFEFPVVVTSYEIVMNDKKFLANYQWRYIIVDEGHRLKNMNCRLIKELMSYNSANRLLLTGTPLQNNIAELWSLLHFLLPEVFNDLDSFERWFDFTEVLEDKEGEDGGKGSKRKTSLVSTMHAILKPFLLRRVKTDVESSLPKKREYILYAPLTTEQKDLYREILSGTSRAYLEEKAVERIESRQASRPTSRASLKRKANGSGRTTPAKSLKSTRHSTPMSEASVGSVRRGRKSNRNSTYREITDGEFNKKLRALGKANNDEDIDINNASDDETPQLSSSEEYEQQRAHTLKLAKKEISSKKLQNPIMQARLACNSPHNFYWPFGPQLAAGEDDQEDMYEDNDIDVDETLITASGKMLLLDTLLPRLFKLGHKVLIFSQFKTTLDILSAYASELRGWKTCRIDGSIAQDERYEQITAFNTDKSYQLFLLSTRAGGQGINLTAADTVVLFDSDWNPQQDLQAMDRAHRIGQTRPVIVYRLATRGTVEESLLLKADGKRRLEKLVIQKGKFKSLFDGVDGASKKLSATEADALKGLLNIDGGQEWEKYDIADDKAGGKLLTEKELAILTDRSDKAYERAEKGLDLDVGVKGKEEGGAKFTVALTRRDGALEELTTKSGTRT
jgi:ATP-dependent DNA helicase